MNERQPDDLDVPGVLMPPPPIYAGCLAVGWVAELCWPIDLLPDGAQYAVGGSIGAFSLVLIALTLIEFRRARTSFDSARPASALIVGGPFRFTRNPAYLALTLLCIGVAIASDSVWLLLSILPAVAITHFGVVKREERYLEHKFGDEYRCYAAGVRRWL